MAIESEMTEFEILSWDAEMDAETIAGIGFSYDEICELYAQVMKERDTLVKRVSDLELTVAYLTRQRGD